MYVCLCACVPQCLSVRVYLSACLSLYPFIFTIIIITVTNNYYYCFVISYIWKSLLWSTDAIYRDFFQLTNIRDFTRASYFFINNLILLTCFRIPYATLSNL